jgi:cell division protein FtsN
MWPELAATPASTDDEPLSAPATGNARRYALAAASLVLVGGALWLGARALNRQGEGEPASPPAKAAQPVTPSRAAPSVAAPRDTAQPTTPAAPPPANPSKPQATGTAMKSAEPTGETYEIVVASFHTAARAADVAAQITALGEPVRRRTTGNWQQVLTGPYASTAKAQEAQQRLVRAGFTGTQIVLAAPSGTSSPGRDR